MREVITVTHGGIEVRYEEHRNRWSFTLRGRERSAESLAHARAAIDKPPPKKKADSEFKPFEAWYGGGYDGTDYRKVMVTSIAESRYSRQEIWIRDNDGRQKVKAEHTYPSNPKNDAIIEAILALRKQTDGLAKQIEREQSKLKAYDAPKEETDAE